MLEFLGKKKGKKVGTPTKKIKPNEDNFESAFDFEIPFNDLIFVKNISKSENPFQSNCQKESNAFKISDFTMDQNFDTNNEEKENDPFLMNNGGNMSTEEELKLPTKLNKRMNSFDETNVKEFDHILTELNLTRHNSTFPIVDFDLEDNEDIGENIYLTQLLTLKSKISLTDANNQNREILRTLKNQIHEEEDRLQKDYEIKENLGKNHPNKEGFICLNKLERIFYYVKKIALGKSNYDNSKLIPKFNQDLDGLLSNLSTSRKEKMISSETDLISDQIKLYNKDSEGYLMRFYQYWIENNSLFMIFELGSYSLADKTEAEQKLPESEVWSLLYNASESLKWIYSRENIHMNVKPGNIEKCKGKYKLVDPFLTKEYLEENLSSGILNRKDTFYLAPEIIEFQTYLEGISFEKCEVYSLGISILENITAMPGYLKNKELNEVKSYFKKHVHGYSSYLKRLLLRMVEKNYKKRPSFDEILCSNIIDEDLTSKKKFNNEFKLKRSNSL